MWKGLAHLAKKVTLVLSYYWILKLWDWWSAPWQSETSLSFDWKRSYSKSTDLSVLQFYLWNWKSPHPLFPLTFFSSLVQTPPYHSLAIPTPVYLVFILPNPFIQRCFPNCRSGHVLLWLKSSGIFLLLAGWDPVSSERDLRPFMDLAARPASSPVTLLPNPHSGHHTLHLIPQTPSASLYLHAFVHAASLNKLSA